MCGGGPKTCDGKRLTMFPPPHCSQSVRGGGIGEINDKEGRKENRGAKTTESSDARNDNESMKALGDQRALG